jgi:Flp pilus assembly protein TadG
VVESLLVTIVLTALFLGIVQVGLALHVRNTLIASAAEGARYAANADRSAEDGAAHAAQLISAALSERFAREVTAGYEDVGDVPTVYVRVRADLPVVGFLGVSRGLDLRGHAFDEAPGESGLP